MALTVGLLAFLAVDATLEGIDIAGDGAAGVRRARAARVLGAASPYLVLTGVDASASASRRQARPGAPARTGGLPRAAGRDRDRPAQPGRGPGDRLGLRGRRAGAGRVPGDRLRAPQHHRGPGDRGSACRDERPASGGSVALGLIAGAPAILGAWIGASAYNPSLAAFLFGAGVGRDRAGDPQLVPGDARRPPAARSTPARGRHPGRDAGALT